MFLLLMLVIVCSYSLRLAKSESNVNLKGDIGLVGAREYVLSSNPPTTTTTKVQY